MRFRDPAWVFWLAIVLSWVFMLLPLPQALGSAKPFVLALILIFYALENPRRLGLGRAFLLGLITDVLLAGMLGEYALRYSVLVFLVLRFRSRLRFFPMWQQSLGVLFLLLNDRVLGLMILAFSGYQVPQWDYWLAPFVGALLWPFVFLLLDDLGARSRNAG